MGLNFVKDLIHAAIFRVHLSGNSNCWLLLFFRGEIDAANHPITMKLTFLCMFGLLMTIGCSPASRSPDAIRQNTASATAAAARDAKAVAQGVFEGLKAKGPLNINTATADELETLPGIGAATTKRIIAGRPYKNSIELLNRHLVTKPEYDRIANRVVAR